MKAHSADAALLALTAGGPALHYDSWSALDRYYKAAPNGLHFVRTAADLAEVASLVDRAEYPGLPHSDLCIRADEHTFHIRCGVETADPADRHPLLSLQYDPARGAYLDPCGIYPMLRQADLFSIADAPLPIAVDELAILAARYPFELPKRLQPSPGPADFSPAAQRLLLTLVLSGNRPWKGLQVLMQSGWVDQYWPELAAMRQTEQAKEHHPEGDAWTHTLETFKYVKTFDVRLALGLLLHDCGKPESQAAEGRRFDMHADIGARFANAFLHRLGFEPAITRDVSFLVQNHMIPGALAVLPTYRTETHMDSPLFPVLLELYRCDLSSTWRGPDGYYEACRVYRQYLRNRSNPFRRSDGSQPGKRRPRMRA